MMGTMGYHFGAIMKEFLKTEKTTDFYEMMLHHIATCSLYFCSTYGNGLAVGATIAYLHDIADIFRSATKCLTTTEYGTATIAIFCVMICNWFWTRLYIFPQTIYYIITTTHSDMVYSFAMVNVVFLSVLQFLHVYWFYLFIVMVKHKIKTGKAEDLQSMS